MIRQLLKLIRGLRPQPSIAKLFEVQAREGEPALPEGLTVLPLGGAKRVSKNWGYELWLAHDRTPFAFKGIHLRAGFRTSLQFHREKEEANLLLSGSGRLWYQDPSTGRAAVREISEGMMIHVRPNTVHRLEAITDLYLIEVSTPELDDVVRLKDDWGRPDGRIQNEHAGEQATVPR